MATTKTDEAIHKLDKTVALLSQDVQGMDKRIVSMEKIVKNGLSSRVEKIHGWMEEMVEHNKERDEIQGREDQQEHEIRLLGIKMSQERKTQIVSAFWNGVFVLLAVVLSHWL